MSFLLFFLLGFLQGVLEWLPVSSEGFLFVIVVSFGEKPSLAFLLSLLFHLPTGFAVLIYFYKRYLNALRSLISGEHDSVFRLLMYSTLGTVVSGVPSYFIYKSFLEEFEVVIEFFSLIAIFLVGLAMVLLGLVSRRALVIAGERSISDGVSKDFFVIGLLQGLSIIPGISRSGITIIGFLFLKYKKEEAVKGSFLMLPIVSFGAFLLEYILGDMNLVFNSYVLVGVLVALVVSLLVIRLLLVVVNRLSFWKFLVFLGVLIVSLDLLYIGIKLYFSG